MEQVLLQNASPNAHNSQGGNQQFAPGYGGSRGRGRYNEDEEDEEEEF